MTKQEIRRTVRALRRSADPELLREYSEACAARLFLTEEWQRADAVYCYVSLPHEVGTEKIFQRARSEGKLTAAPLLRGKDMLFSAFRGPEDLVPGRMNIREPAAYVPVPALDPLVVMPGIAFDRSLHRVGYGGGYYDRYLHEHPGLMTCALAFGFTVFDSVPYEDFDISPGFLITERETIRRSGSFH